MTLLVASLLVTSILLGKNSVILCDKENVVLKSELDIPGDLVCTVVIDTLNKQKSGTTEPTFYFDDNGVTIKCMDCVAGDKGIVNGIEYEAVDRELLMQRRDEGADLSKLCTSLVTDMSFLFHDASSFNEDISSWDVSNVADMTAMFLGATSFNQNIGYWDVGALNSAAVLFNGATAFNQNIGSWNVSNVISMSCLFKEAVSFNQDISSWNVGNVIDMDSMFAGASAFNQNISSWDVGNVMSMPAMFFEASSFDQDLSSWNVNAVFDMYVMFYSSGLSTENYSKILIGWASQSLQKSVYLDAGNIKYNASAQESRQYIIDTYEWTIVDGGLDASGTDSTNTGIGDTHIDNSIFVYPNPANDKLYIETNSSGEVKLFDLNGKIVLNQRIENGKNELDISDFMKGSYFLRCEFKDGIHIVQFVKN
ncbi:BspA family leucine-rich repeat surface protein [Maribellus sediminis]|uniref:BspA family leucine-rich repeat surface protein n=1 Tax=Maribellus sediminis TaxID=2696285 RepID=UPI0014308170|nr:BspA family leucine-rich repeat surface protein [Maribellus sediminis]